MFTGIVEEVGTVADAWPLRQRAGADVGVRVRASAVLDDLAVGDSIAVSGCCLTAVAVGQGAFDVELSRETLDRTAPRWREGARVNLERALAAAGRFGGHIVSGHVEGVGEVTSVRREAGAVVLAVRAPERLAGYLIPKGSVTVDGVSLTVVDVGGPGGSRADLGASDFTLALIPHTLAHTTLDELAPGARVNLETDVLARYAERLALVREASGGRPTAEVADGPHAS